MLIMTRIIALIWMLGFPALVAYLAKNQLIPFQSTFGSDGVFFFYIIVISAWTAGTEELLRYREPKIKKEPKA